MQAYELGAEPVSFSSHSSIFACAVGKNGFGGARINSGGGAGLCGSSATGDFGAQAGKSTISTISTSRKLHVFLVDKLSHPFRVFNETLFLESHSLEGVILLLQDCGPLDLLPGPETDPPGRENGRRNRRDDPVLRDHLPHPACTSAAKNSRWYSETMASVPSCPFTIRRGWSFGLAARASGKR